MTIRYDQVIWSNQSINHQHQGSIVSRAFVGIPVLLEDIEAFAWEDEQNDQDFVWFCRVKSGGCGWKEMHIINLSLTYSIIFNHIITYVLNKC